MSDFAQRLQGYLEELKGLRARAASEDSIREGFRRFLRKEVDLSWNT